MKKPESDDERRERLLRELEGKNISYYSIILQTVIESEIETANQIAGFSSAAIGLIFTVDAIRENSSGSSIVVYLSLLSLVGFSVAIMSAILFIGLASRRYENEIRSENAVEGYGKLLDCRKHFVWARNISVVAFCVGIVTFTGAAALEISSGL